MIKKRSDKLYVWTISSRYRYLFMLATLFGGSFLLITSNSSYFYNNIEYDRLTMKPIFNAHDKKYSVRTKGCSIPAMLPLDKTVKEFVKYPKTMTPCPNADSPLLEHNRTHIWLSTNDEIMIQYNITQRYNLVCCYQSFYRPRQVLDIESRYIDNRIKYNNCSFFNQIKKVEDEFVRVTCFSNHFDGPVYEQFFIFALKKEIPYKKEITNNKPSYNIIILGIDNLSRLNFHRTMPKTVAFIKEKGAIELMGYNKVGDNSYPNLVPLLLGYEETELKRICHPSRNSNFDECPFIWHRYKDEGFYTAFAEDTASLGTFNYNLDGFRKTPTDYYAHPFILQAERYVGTNKDKNTFLCMNNIYFFQVLLNYIENIIETLRYSRLFGFFWEVTMSHDYLNYPMIMDDSYEILLKRLESSKYLDETIVLIVSDHGIRWGPIRSTKQGRLEERLPLVFMLTPPSFQTNFSQAFNNLKLNSRKLTTPFDIHETLVDLVDLENIKNEKLEARSSEFYSNDRGISLFLPVPSNRTCKMAHIDDHWCTCHRSKKVSKWSIEANDASKYLITFLNLMLKNYPECTPLELAEVISAIQIVADTPRKDEMNWMEYMVAVKANPSEAIFEATLLYDGQNWTVIGTPSRLNQYGRQSQCVDDSHLKLYCFCL